MRTEGFGRSLIGISLILALALTISFILTPVRATAVISHPGGTTVDATPGENFTLRHRLAWQEPANPGFYLVAIWWDYYADNAWHFTLDSASAYFDNDDPIDATVSTKDNGTRYSLAVANAAGDWRDGEFTVDITLRAAGPDGTPHSPTNNHPIQYTIIQSLEAFPPAAVAPGPVTVRVLSRGLDVAISPGYQSGPPGTTLSYSVMVTNTGTIDDTYELTISDNESWGLLLSENLFENVAPGENKTAMLSVTVPEIAVLCTRDNVTISVTSWTDNAVENSASCIAHAFAPDAQQWDAIITATFPDGSDDAIFGVRPDATAGFDTAYDIPEPHAPPEPPHVRAYFYYHGQTLDELHRSCLAPENLMEWPLRIEYADDIENITLTWSVENVLPDYAVLLFEDENLVADMRAVDNYTFQTASGDFDFTIRVAVAVAWQLIETWTGNVSTPAEWQLIKIWTGTIEAPAAWQLLETWTGTVEAPIAWQLVDTWIGTIQTPVPPAAPSLISPADGTTTSDNTPTFDWSDVAGAENYDLLVDNDPDFSSPDIQVTVSISTYTPTAELTDDNYSWKVRTRDAASNVGDWSSIWTLLIKTIVRSVEVSISPESKSGLPGETLTYEVTVTNEGNVEDTYDLAASDTAGWNPTVSPTSLTIAAGGSDTATLNVTIPSDASVGDEDTIEVTVTSRTEPTVGDSDSCTVHATALRRVEVSISPDNQSGSPKENLPYILTVKNTGTIADNYSLTVSDNENWNPTLSDDLVEIPAGGEENVTLTVTIPENAENGAEDNITVTATSTENAEVSASDSCTATAIVVRSVEVSISPENQSGAPGTTLVYTVMVKNTGNVEDNYLLSLVDNAIWNPSIFPTSLTVPTGENRLATLTVTIPENAAICTEDNITVIATSEVDNTVSAEDSCIAHAIERTVIDPAVDVYAFSGNGTRYSRTQLKFDIHSIPSKANILSAKLWLYRLATDNWDGEILLNRVDDQLWDENITDIKFNAQTLTDEETRAGKFISPGWDYLDVENQLNVDHEAGHAYSSYRLRWANDNGSEPSVGIDDGRFLAIQSEHDELSIIFSSSEHNGSDPYLEVVYYITHGWDLIETLTGTIEAFAEWRIMEPWNGTISAPVEWKLIETWNGTVSAPAEWQLIEIWTGTVKVIPAWKLIETWNGTVSAPAEWQLIEIWTGTASVPVAPLPGRPSLISPADGTITSDKTPTFDWSDVTGAENYDLLVDSSPNFSSPEIQVTVPVSTYTPTAELPLDNYSWKVRARDAADNVSDWSSTWTLLIKTIIRRVDASISPESKGGHPEETLTYTVTIVNEGDDEDTYDLTVTDALAWDPTVSPTSLTIPAGGSGTATVSVTIPEGMASGTEDEITVTATSRTDLTVSDSATCIAITTAVRSVKVSISPENQSGAPEEMLTYEVTVKNEGNIGDTYILSVAGVTDWWPRVENTSLTLNAGGVGETTLTVTIPPGVTEGLSITVNVSAISVGDPRVVGSDTCRTIVKGVPAVPEWDFGLPLMISALLIGAVLLTPAYLLRARSKKAARRRVLRGPRVWS